MTLSTPLLLGGAASLATAAGGVLALRWRHRLMLIVALAAGVVLGVAVFDLLPEAIELGAPIVGGRSIGLAVAGGLGGYVLLARGTMRARATSVAWRAHLAPATLTLHSLVDGLGIGLAFQASAQVGWVVAAAVLTHDLVDGVNIVGLTLASRTEAAARRWLAMNSAAPLAGAALVLRVSARRSARATIMSVGLE